MQKSAKVIVAFVCKNNKVPLWIKNENPIHLYKPIE